MFLRKSFSIAALAALVVSLAACTTPPTRQQMGIGTGAVVGGVVGNVLTGGLLGTVGGAAVGGVIGNEMSKHR
jgi:osmotically inducible lipoprotein OsmB